jgi:predicted negative regulator of RcsB-dependent stress response
MTHPLTDNTTRDQPKVESFMDWFHVNSRWVGIGAVIALAAIAGTWYSMRAKAIKLENADRQLLVAKQSVASGNVPLAESDLQKVADRYAGTTAGAEAGLMLGQLKLEKGDYQGAAEYLKGLSARLDGPNAASAKGLLGDAYSQLNKPAEAAAEYEAAANSTKMPSEKAFYLARAGNAYMDANRNAEARRIWEALSKQQDNAAVAAEARVRLGAMTAQPVQG